jgi:hypothetical protein
MQASLYVDDSTQLKGQWIQKSAAFPFAPFGSDGRSAKLKIRRDMCFSRQQVSLHDDDGKLREGMRTISPSALASQMVDFSRTSAFFSIC